MIVLPGIMDINRRNFIRLFSTAAVSALGPIEKLAAFDGSSFSSEILGLTLRIPQNWHRPTLDEVKARLAKQTLEASENDELISPTPIVAIDKYKEPHNGMNPTIVIYGDNVEDWMVSPIDLARNYVRSFSECVVEGECIDTPVETTIDGFLVAEVTFQYLCVVETDNFEHYVTDYSKIIFNGDKVIWILMEESQDGPEFARQEFDEVLSSIVLQPIAR